MSLTRRQDELLDFIISYVNENAVAPSFDEMKDALGLKAKSGIKRMLDTLEERGKIRRLSHRARAIEVVGASDNSLFVSRLKMCLIKIVHECRYPDNHSISTIKRLAEESLYAN